MSIKVTSAVWEYSQHKGGNLLVLLAIADFADDNGIAFPSIATLARKSRLSERQIHYGLNQLQESGELTISRNDGPYRANLYRVQLLQGAIIAGCNPLQGEGAVFAGEGAMDCSQRVQSSAGGNRQGTVNIEPSYEPSNKLNKGAGENFEELDQWPEWYALLQNVRPFDQSAAAAEAWRVANGISPEVAQSKAYAVRDWWPTATKRRRENGNPYLTWQRFCIEARAGPSPPNGAHHRNGNGAKSTGGANGITSGNSAADFAEEQRKQRERQQSRARGGNGGPGKA